jgi:hypothetical protein
MTRYPTAVIFITASVWSTFAVWLGLNPHALLTAFGMETSTPAMLTEIRAFYGGVEIAIAVSMIVLWFRGELFASLLIGGLPLAGSSAARTLGVIVDGFSSLHAGLAAVEFMGALLCTIGCGIILKREKAATPPD